MDKVPFEEIKIFDGIHRIPIDKTARLVVQKGEHYNSPAKPTDGLEHWENQPIYYRIPGNSPVRRGERFGRLVVLGRRNIRKIKGRPPKYVVRCDCGHFEIRTAKGLICNKSKTGMCYLCRFDERRKFSEGTQHAA